MEELLPTEYVQMVELDPILWDQLVDLLSTSITVDTMILICVCLCAGILLGLMLWRWMR